VVRADRGLDRDAPLDLVTLAARSRRNGQTKVVWQPIAQLVGSDLMSMHIESTDSHLTEMRRRNRAVCTRRIQ